MRISVCNSIKIYWTIKDLFKNDNLEREEAKNLPKQCVRAHGFIEVICLGFHQMSGCVLSLYKQRVS